jgi:hypothetical protein
MKLQLLVEQELANLESMVLGFNSIQERFCETVLKEFSLILKSAAWSTEISMKRSGCATYLDADDIFQEILLYMFEWNLSEVISKSTLEQLWIPSIRNSVRNCIANLSQHVLTRKRQPEGGFVEELFEPLCKRGPIDVRLICKEAVEELTNTLTKEERVILQVLVDPPEDLKEFRKTRKGGSTISLRVISEYVGVSYSCVRRVVGLLRKVAIQNGFA